MILLDTNVISEFMRVAPDEGVVAWLDRQPAGSVWTTVITVFEIEYGLKRLDPGKRRDQLEMVFQASLTEDLDGRILPFDAVAASNAGALAAELDAQGLPLEIRDLQIASIARVHGAVVATRNTKHFEGSCQSLNPWTDG